jgi:hypothetical protein
VCGVSQFQFAELRCADSDEIDDTHLIPQGKSRAVSATKNVLQPKHLAPIAHAN